MVQVFRIETTRTFRPHMAKETTFAGSTSAVTLQPSFRTEAGSGSTGRYLAPSDASMPQNPPSKSWYLTVPSIRIFRVVFCNWVRTGFRSRLLRP